MVTQAIETGISPSTSQSRGGKKFWDKVVYIVGLGCCMTERKSKSKCINTTSSNAQSSLDEIKIANVNWSTSTLGMETDFNISAARESDLNSPSTQDARDISLPLSSFEFYTPPVSPAVPAPVARPSFKSRSSLCNEKRQRHETESPVITITDHDIATGKTASSGKCWRERNDRDQEKVSTLQAWSQIDPLYGMYQQEREESQARARTRTKEESILGDSRV